MSYSLTDLNYDHDNILKALQDIKDTTLQQTVNVEWATDAMGGHKLAQDMIDAFLKLWECINAEDSSGTGFVDVFVMFDKAHVLAKVFNTSRQSNFVKLQQALQVLVKVPLFMLFLSTTGKVSQFIPQHRNDASSHINNGIFKTPCPFINFGFDQMMKDCRVMEKFKPLDDAPTWEDHCKPYLYYIYHSFSKFHQMWHGMEGIVC
jgi:hypothetical protein